MTVRPQDYRYNESHEWAHMDGDVVAIGITDYAAQQLGDLTYLELPAVGDGFAAGETFGVIESVKTASDLIAPVGGEVVEVHEEVAAKFSLISDTPFTDGWLIRLRPSDPAEYDAMMDAGAYEKLLESEQH
ncbi:MAG: glycine cleavage system protein GcvH [Planctomycetota bacterium]|nr:MAG: glycine cleavage system protein GcvH [Planctomycetota bacterium]